MKTQYEYNKKYRQTHVKQRNLDRQRYYGKYRMNNFNKRVRWTIEHIEMVLAHTIPDSQLSKLIGRSVGAIQKIRGKMKHATL